MLTIADANAIGKHLEKNKGQDEPLNRAILEVLEKIANLEDAGDAQMEEGAGNGHGEVDGDALDESPIVHVTPVRAGGAGVDGLPASRGHAEAAEHGTERKLEALQATVDPGAGCVVFEVDFPGEEVHLVLKLWDITGVKDVGGNRRPGPAGAAVGHHVIKGYGQSIAGCGALDVERTGLGVAAWGDGFAAGVFPSGIHGGGADGVPAGNAEHGFVGTDCGVVDLGYEFVMGHSISFRTHWVNLWKGSEDVLSEPLLALSPSSTTNTTIKAIVSRQVNGFVCATGLRRPSSLPIRLDPVGFWVHTSLCALPDDTVQVQYSLAWGFRRMDGFG